MTGDAEYESGRQHWEQSVPYDWHVFDLEHRTFVVYDVPEGGTELYAVSATSRNVRTFAKADAALYDGQLVGTSFDEDLGTVDFFHSYAGRIDSRHVDEWLDEPAVRLKKIPATQRSELHEVLA